MLTKLCKKCGYVWEAKSEHPKRCPRCKVYTWDSYRMVRQWDYKPPQSIQEDLAKKVAEDE